MKLIRGAVGVANAQLQWFLLALTELFHDQWYRGCYRLHRRSQERTQPLSSSSGATSMKSPFSDLFRGQSLPGSTVEF